MHGCACYGIEQDCNVADLAVCTGNRDEVLAEWIFDGEGQASLHVHCHVSGEERWLAPPALRNYIFQREMPLVSSSSS